MNYLDRYLKYLEMLKKENLGKNERKRDCSKLVEKGQALLRNLEDNFELINEEDIKKIFSLMNNVDVEGVITELKNINVFRRYFNNEKFMNQPQVIRAKNNLAWIKSKIKDCLTALEKIISEIVLADEEKINSQVNLVKRIKKRDVLSSEELSNFYQMLLECTDKEIDINVIIMDVVLYMNELLSKQVKEKEKYEPEEITKEKDEDVLPVLESIKEEKQLNDLTKEELENIDYYKNMIEEIFKIGEKHHINNFLGLELTYQFGDSMPRFTREVSEKIGIELTFEIVKLLEEFNEVVTLEKDVRTLLDDEYLLRIREMLPELEAIFKQGDEVAYTDEEVESVLDKPKSLVVFLHDVKARKSFVERDYEAAVTVDKNEARLAVKHLIDYYSKHVEPRKDRQDSKSEYEGIKLLHTKAGHRARSYYLNMSVSEVVKLFLREKYGADEVYLYTGFVNIGNHGENYADIQYNRMRKKYNDIVYLMRLFNKKMLTEHDKREISGLIEGAIDITKRLNGIEGKKRYE